MGTHRFAPDIPPTATAGSVRAGISAPKPAVPSAGTAVPAASGTVSGASAASWAATAGLSPRTPTASARRPACSYPRRGNAAHATTCTTWWMGTAFISRARLGARPGAGSVAAEAEAHRENGPRDRHDYCARHHRRGDRRASVVPSGQLCQFPVEQGHRSTDKQILDHDNKVEP